MKKLAHCLLGLLGISTLASAADLMEIYNQALQSDPKLQSAYANYLSVKENVAINRASLLPSINGQANLKGMRSSYVTQGNSSVTNSYQHQDYSISLTQPIFNFGNWAKLQGASATAKQAQAKYDAASQDLMVRVSKAYFKVLEAEDYLRFTQAEKLATAKQLDQAKQRYKVGLDAITSVYDAQASYDSIVAQEIAAQNDLVNRREELREITGTFHEDLAGLKNQLPLVTPQPANTEAWVETARKQNFNLSAARFAVDTAKQNIRANFAGHLPTLNATAGYNESSQSKNDAINGLRIDNAGSSVGLQLNVPLFAGGSVAAQTRQAQYGYQKSLADLEDTYRNTLDLTRQAYNSINAYISKIKADR
ncbi:MAG: tolC, partial [Gammaproteobacteria bacterium]|nr:tolC [Gammaproteobacteria bacterium]